MRDLHPRRMRGAASGVVRRAAHAGRRVVRPDRPATPPPARSVSPGPGTARGIKASKLSALLLDAPSRFSDSMVDEQIAKYAGGLQAVARQGVITDRSQLRRLLGGTERLEFHCPVTVRFEPGDVQLIDTERFRIAVDRADPAVGGVIATSRDWEPHTSAVLRDHLRPGMSVLDVGANIGWFSLLAASLVGPTGRVIAVEPWSENCRLLLISRAENGYDNVELWPFALDRRRGWANFTNYVGSNAGYISDSPEAIAAGAGTIVPTFALDDVLPEDHRLDLIKIDVEGAEHRVLDGAHRTLAKWRPIVISEFSLEMSRRVCGGEPADYIAWFLDRGWQLHVVDRQTGKLVPFLQVSELLDWWPHPHHIEDLLFLPQ